MSLATTVSSHSAENMSVIISVLLQQEKELLYVSTVTSFTHSGGQVRQSLYMEQLFINDFQVLCCSFRRTGKQEKCQWKHITFTLIKSG